MNRILAVVHIHLYMVASIKEVPVTNVAMYCTGKGRQLLYLMKNSRIQIFSHVHCRLHVCHEW